VEEADIRAHAKTTVIYAEGNSERKELQIKSALRSALQSFEWLSSFLADHICRGAMG
jgi:hypothetical protein